MDINLIVAIIAGAIGWALFAYNQFSTPDGKLFIDKSDPEKDQWDLELYTAIPEVEKKRRVIFKIIVIERRRYGKS